MLLFSAPDDTENDTQRGALWCDVLLLVSTLSLHGQMSSVSPGIECMLVSCQRLLRMRSTRKSFRRPCRDLQNWELLAARSCQGHRE